MTIFPSDTKIWVGSWTPAASPSQWLQTSNPILERMSGSKKSNHIQTCILYVIWFLRAWMCKNISPQKSKTVWLTCGRGPLCPNRRLLPGHRRNELLSGKHFQSTAIHRTKRTNKASCLAWVDDSRAGYNPLHPLHKKKQYSETRV